MLIMMSSLRSTLASEACSNSRLEPLTTRSVSENSKVDELVAETD